MSLFCLETEDEISIDEQKAYKLMSLIITWAEENHNQIGGGYHPIKDEDVSSF
ncbi:hypothetical protein [Tenacibaculum xiamenense]|uniref:hypothetical protein n=1 Tax=Tenacibaculum xiamenense TaxID=1261553 RepID=UPI0038B6A010